MAAYIFCVHCSMWNGQTGPFKGKRPYIQWRLSYYRLYVHLCIMIHTPFWSGQYPLCQYPVKQMRYIGWSHSPSVLHLNFWDSKCLDCSTPPEHTNRREGHCSWYTHHMWCSQNTSPVALGITKKKERLKYRQPSDCHSSFVARLAYTVCICSIHFLHHFIPSQKNYPKTVLFSWHQLQGIITINVIL